MDENEKSKILTVFKALLTHYGRQGWWPGESSLEIVVGAILVQRTRWEAAARVIVRLKNNDLLDLRILANMQPLILEKYLKGVNYYRQKAQRIINLCRGILSKYGSLEKAFSCPVTELRSFLLSVNGIGPETADSIILYAANKLSLPVSEYTVRVLTRIGIKNKGGYDRWREFLMESLPRNIDVYKEFHALMVTHGRKICKKSPLCDLCPISSICESGKS